MINTSPVVGSSVPLVEEVVDRDPVSMIFQGVSVRLEPVRLNLKNYRWYHIASAVLGTALLFTGAYTAGIGILTITLIAREKLRSHNARLQQHAIDVVKINTYRAYLENFILLLRNENENPVEKAQQILNAFRAININDELLSRFMSNVQIAIQHLNVAYEVLGDDMEHLKLGDLIALKEEVARLATLDRVLTQEEEILCSNETNLRYLAELIRNIPWRVEQAYTDLRRYQESISPTPGQVPDFPAALPSMI